MSYQQKELCGSLFKNKKREKDSHPQATGTATIGGVEYWVSAWTKKDKNGDPWQSLAFKPKDDAKGGRRQLPGKSDQPGYDDPPLADEDDDIPF